MFRGFVTRQQNREYFDDPAQSIQDPTPLYDQFLPFISAFVDGGIAVHLPQAPPSDFLIHSTWNYSLAGMYELPWDVSVAGTVYGRQGYPRGDVITVNRPDGLGLTPVLMNRDLGNHRFPSVHLVDVRLQKRLALGRARATLNVDVFNTFNGTSTLRQFTEATAITFGQPLEIVAPRLVRLGLQLQF